MTPPLIDERGRVLGKVNIIDGLVVQLGAGVAAAGVAFVAPASSTLWAAGIAAADLLAVYGLSRAPEPTAAEETPNESDAESEPADAETSASAVTVEVPDNHEVVVRPRSTVRADGGDN